MKIKNRTPNTNCSLCKIPLYRPPNALYKTKTIACSNCHGIAKRERMKSDPSLYRNMIAKSMERKGIRKTFHCMDCSKEILHGHKRCIKCVGKTRSGENHYNWKGGITSEQRMQRVAFHRQIRVLVFERDNYTCQMCGDRGVKLQVDHIQPWAEYVELRFSMDNCRTLCVNCHYKITWGKPLATKTTKWGNRKEGGSYFY